MNYDELIQLIRSVPPMENYRMENLLQKVLNICSNIEFDIILAKNLFSNIDNFGLVILTKKNTIIEAQLIKENDSISINIMDIKDIESIKLNTTQADFGNVELTLKFRGNIELKLENKEITNDYQKRKFAESIYELIKELTGQS